MAVSSFFKRPGVWLTLCALITVATLWQFHSRFPFDDTFISFRYAEHLAKGHGLVWNIGGPPTEGYTNFLFILLLSAARFVTNNLLFAAQLIGMVCTITTGLLLYESGRTLRSSPVGLLAAVLYYTAPLTWVNGLSGMETSLFVLLVVATLTSVAKNRIRPALVFAFLATLTRPEGALLAALILILQLTDRTSIPRAVKNWLIWFAIPCLIYAVWKYLYFGQLLPNSFYIKVLDKSHSVLPGLQYVRLFVTSVLALVAASLTSRHVREPALLAAILWVVMLILFYLFVTPLEGLYDRFLWPAFTVLCLTASVGVSDAVSRYRVGMAYPAILLLAANCLLMRVSPRTNQVFAAHEDVWDVSMDKIVDEINRLPHRDSILLGYGDAGYVVYRTGIQHLDLFGLNDSRIAHAKSKEERAAIVRAERPDILLLPVRLADTGQVLVEDAYGLARTSQFSLVGSFPAFPYTLGIYVNAESRYAADVRSHFSMAK